jgi:putative hydrolase of the HAD superfamily
VISEECGRAKPAPEIFRRACAMLDVPSNEAIYVGDRYDIDAEAARQARLRGVWLDRRGKATGEHQAPIIRTLNELSILLDF